MTGLYYFHILPPNKQKQKFKYKKYSFKLPNKNNDDIKDFFLV